MGLVVLSIQPVCFFWLEHYSIYISDNYQYICSYCHFLNCLVLIFRSLFFFVFLDHTNPFNICCKAGLVVLNSLNFCLSVKLFISPSVLNEILAGYSNLGCRIFPFSTLNTSCHSPLTCRISAERSAVNQISFSFYVIY